MKALIDFTGTPLECVSFHRVECPCIFSLRLEANIERYLKIMDDWNLKVIEVANREEFHNRQV